LGVFVCLTHDGAPGAASADYYYFACRAS